MSRPSAPPARRELDLSGVPCPLNWVRTRLTLEAMAPGQELWVHLDAGEPRESVPRAAREDGHAVHEGREVVRIVRR